MKHLLLMVIVLAIPGCASSSSSSSSSSSAPTPQAPPSVAEIIKDVEEATAALQKTVSSLQYVSDGRGDLAKGRADFHADLAALDAKVQEVRDAAIFLTQRRDEFLKHWLEKSGEIKSAELKAAAEKRRTEIMTEFMTLGGKGSELRRAFAPVNAALRDCARFLESDATVGAAKMLAPEVENIRKMEPEVVKAAGDYTSQLKKIQDRLSASK
jgi:hypothetical protein